MPGYTKKALKQFKHERRKLQHQPYPSAIIKYGAKTQYATAQSTLPQLDKHGKKFIQQVCGKFLFLGRAVESTLLCPISAIASQAAKPTKDTMKQTLQLLDYIATQEEAVLTYSTSDMKLVVHSDASYLSEPQSIQQGRRALLPLQRSHNTSQQWRCAQHCTHHQTCHDVSHRSRIGSIIHHDKRSSVYQNSVNGNGPQTTFDTIANRQRHRRGGMQQQDPT